MPDDVRGSLVRAFGQRLAGTKAVVICSQQADALEWRRLLATAGCTGVLVLAFDGPDLGPLLPSSCSRSAGQLITDRRSLIATLDGDSPSAGVVDRFDPDRQAVVLVTDPVDPPRLRRRRLFGAKHPSWSLCEHKSVVDTVWDVIGVPRAESLVFDQPTTLLRRTGLNALNVVLSAQRRGGQPSAGGADVRLLAASVCLPTGQTGIASRIRAMPVMAGLPCRLHGLVLPETTAVFPPLELLVPHRPSDGAFLCAGSWPLTGTYRQELTDLTQSLGDALRDHLAYRGGFSVDGILTAGGFRPTDLNTRVTSAFEDAPPALRVAVHASALLAREDQCGVDALALARLTGDSVQTGELVLRTPAPAATRSARLPARWSGTALTACPAAEAHGVLQTASGARGMVLTIRLRHDGLPPDMALQAVAVAAFQAADLLLDTRLGELKPPRAAPVAAPNQRSGVA